jgi:alpha-ketoglutarate-dependent taurine dioxygenase
MNSILEAIQTQGYAFIRNPDSVLQDFVTLTEQWGQAFLSLKKPDASAKTSHSPPKQIIGSHLGRTPLSGYEDIFLNSSSGSTFPLPLHGELYYQRISPPEGLFLYCHVPPAKAGETLLCNGIKLFESLPSSVQNQLLAQKISYTRYSSKELWQNDYATQDADALLVFLAQHNIQGEMDEQGELKTVFTTSAVTKANGKHCFINNLIPFALREYQEPEATRSRVRFENGKPISRDLLNTIIHAAQQHQVSFSWKTGDTLVIDNRCCMHGRNQLFEGPRTLYLRMAQHLRLSSV